LRQFVVSRALRESCIYFSVAPAVFSLAVAGLLGLAACRSEARVSLSATA
jgi:hypothetical protein